MTKTKSWGGARRGAGRYIQRFQVDKATAQTYKLLVIQRGWVYTAENVAKIAAELAESAWQEIDQEIESTPAWEGQIL